MRSSILPLAVLCLALTVGCGDGGLDPSRPASGSSDPGPYRASGVGGGLGLVVDGVGLRTQPASFSVDVPVADASEVVAAWLYWSGRGGNNVGDDSIVINGMTYDGGTTPAVELASSYAVNSGARWAFFYRMDVKSLITPGTNSFDVSGFDLPADILEDGIGIAVIYADDESEYTEIHVLEPFEFVYWGDIDFTQGMVHPFSFDSAAVLREGRFVLFAGDAKDDRPDTIWWTTGAGAPPADMIGGPFDSIVDALVSANGDEFDVLDVTGIPVPAGDDFFAYQLESPQEGNGDSMLHSFAAFCVPTPREECTGRIGDLVWYDENGNGLQDEGEPGIEGVSLSLCLDGQEVDTTTSGSDGTYYFEGLCAGDYVVKVDESTVPEGLMPCECNVGSDDTIDNDCSPANVTLETDSSEDLTIDFGYCDEPTPGDHGCTPGYWKNHLDSWPPTGFTPGQSVESVFSEMSLYPELANVSLEDALAFRGGPAVEGAVRILMRAAVAAVLNASHPAVEYPRSAGDVVTDVNDALATQNRQQILSLATDLDEDNNLGCPLN